MTYDEQYPTVFIDVNGVKTEVQAQIEHHVQEDHEWFSGIKQLTFPTDFDGLTISDERWNQETLESAILTIFNETSDIKGLLGCTEDRALVTISRFNKTSNIVPAYENLLLKFGYTYNDDSGCWIAKTNYYAVIEFDQSVKIYHSVSHEAQCRVITEKGLEDALLDVCNSALMPICEYSHRYMLTLHQNIGVYSQEQIGIKCEHLLNNIEDTFKLQTYTPHDKLAFLNWFKNPQFTTETTARKAINSLFLTLLLNSYERNSSINSFLHLDMQYSVVHEGISITIEGEAGRISKVSDFIIANAKDLIKEVGTSNEVQGTVSLYCQIEWNNFNRAKKFFKQLLYSEFNQYYAAHLFSETGMFDIHAHPRTGLLLH
ncbi:MAG: hypothetical protein HAW67_03455 [Endozoicomonadaceae bacterium]|nr:hypothetical protein [Endozoicomonadaceae bacterium]